MNCPVAALCRSALCRGRSLLLWGFVTALATLPAIPACADVEAPQLLEAPQPSDRLVTRAVVKMLRDDHLRQHPLDDEISHRLFKGFIRMLDPQKLYFYQTDYDGFLASQNDLDNQINRSDVSFSYTVFLTYLRRIDERVALAKELIDAKHDFAVNEELSVDFDAAHFPKDAAEARELWRKRIKYDLLALKADATSKDPAEAEKSARPPEDPRARLHRRYRGLAKRMHQTDHDELLEMYLTSLTTAFDPHTNYMSASTYDNFNINMSLNLEGIGASLQYDDGFTVVKQIIPGGAADRDGRLKVEDRIVGVGKGEKGDIVDTVEMRLNDVVGMIRGPRGTTVRLEVVPAGQAERTTYTIVRDEIKLTDQEARSVIIDEKRDGRTFKLGVIDLPSFYMDMNGAKEGLPNFKSTTRDVTNLLKDFNAKHVDAVVLDLRRNGGGSLNEAINLTGLFIDSGPVVQVKDKDGKLHIHNDEKQGTLWSGPLVVLTSKLSASASEIFAGAVQDYERGLIVGDKTTHGKGTVQSLFDIGQRLIPVGHPPRLGALKITIQQFYRPNGDSTQNRGVLADVELPSLTNVVEKLGEADLDYALKFEAIKPVHHKLVHMVDRAWVERLRQNSLERQKSSTGFQKLMRDIDRYQEQKGKKTVSLNERTFMAERAELNAEREEEKQFEELTNSKRPVFDTNYFYNQEALAITVDYLEMMPLARAD